MTATPNPRLDVLDALRGFAIVSIMLLHNIEHFDIYHQPEGFPVWLSTIDGVIWEILFFLFGGKSFAIFALLFGVTFHIQHRNRKLKGERFRSRFVWRMLLLFLFGIVNSAFFQGDILSIYAALGLLLVPLAGLNVRYSVILLVILMAQPITLFDIVYAFVFPEMTVQNPISWTYFGRMDEYIKDDSLFRVMVGNLSNGKLAVLNWNYENGRFFSILGLFVLGRVLALKGFFERSEQNRKRWSFCLYFSIPLFLMLYSLQVSISDFVENKLLLRSLQTIIASWANLSFTNILLSVFIMLFHVDKIRRKLSYLSASGKMSLSNYVFQSIIGTFIYYNYGIGLYKYTGATICLIIGIVLSVIFMKLCSHWSLNHRRGPLETVWHRLTWI